jgi:outer membrane protein TolC
MASETDEQDAVVKYYTVHKTIDSTKDQRKLTAWKLNDLMGQSVVATLKVKEFSISPKKIDIGYDELAEQALAKSLALSQKERDIKNTEIDYNDDDNKDKRGTYAAKLDVLKVDLENVKESIKESCKSSIDSLQKNYLLWENAVISKNKAENDYKISQKRYELGLISKLELMAGELAYQSALDTEKKALEAWYTAERKVELAKEGITNIQ